MNIHHSFLSLLPPAMMYKSTGVAVSQNAALSPAKMGRAVLKPIYFSKNLLILCFIYTVILAVACIYFDTVVPLTLLNECNIQR